jgi:hypothetical protein
VTFTLIVQLATVLFSAAPAPPIVIVPAPAAAVRNAGLVTTVTPVGQVVLATGVAAITTPVGKVSVNKIPDCAGLPAPFVMVKVSVEMPLIAIVAGLNILLKVVCTTDSVALTPAAVKPPVNPPMFALLLIYVLSVEAVTFTETVQVAGAAASVMLDNAILVAFATAVTLLPAQLLTTAGVAAIVKPLGKLSVKPKPLTLGAPLPLVIVKVKVETPPLAILVGENALVSAGAVEKITVAFTPVVVIPALAPVMLAALVLL